MSEFAEQERLIAWLKESWLFADLDDGLCSDLCLNSKRRLYPEGSTLMAQGTAASEALLVLAGSATVSRTIGHNEPLTVRLAKPGDVIGEMGLICGQARSATVMAHEDCEVLVIRQAVFHQLIKAQPTFALRVMEVLCRRIVEGNHAWELAHAYGMDARLASLLLDLYDRFPTEVSGQHFIGVRLTHADIAAMLGVARENVTKGIAKFKRAGAIATTRGRIEMLDTDELVSWIC